MRSQAQWCDNLHVQCRNEIRNRILICLAEVSRSSQFQNIRYRCAYILGHFERPWEHETLASILNSTNTELDDDSNENIDQDRLAQGNDNWKNKNKKVQQLIRLFFFQSSQI